MKYSVFIAADADDDLLEINRYIRIRDGKDRAAKIIADLREECLSLADFPERGHVTQEMELIGVLDYREVHIIPYRIIYQITGQKVFVHAILDGRRDIQTLLQERLIR